MRDSKYFRWGAAVFLVIVASCSFCLLLLNLRTVGGAIGAVVSAVTSILYGLAIAYLINPIVRRVETFLLKHLRSRLPKKSARGLSRGLGIVTALILLLAIVFVLFYLLIPQLLDSLMMLANNLPVYFSSVERLVTDLLENYPEAEDLVNSAIDSAYAWLQDFLQNDLPGLIQSFAVSLTSSLISLVMVIVNLVVGLVVSIYVLINKDRFLAQAKKMAIAFFPPRIADWLMAITARADHIFGGFIRGKLVDSAIIGVLCYIGMTILGLPYTVLVSVVIGVTNVIPFFGPYIGAIPSTLLILVVDPWQGLYFLIFILVLQQIDGNIIGPRILGDATGLTSFWVVVAITLFGGLFGFAGMILGVPTFALLYSLVADLVNHCLRKKGRPTATRLYYHIHTAEDLDPAGPGGEVAPDAGEDPAGEADEAEAPGPAPAAAEPAEPGDSGKTTE